MESRWRSSCSGRHGAGAALAVRREHGAVYGVGVGPTGNAYAIPTKDQDLNVLTLPEIKRYVDGFLSYARSHPELVFNVTRIGCGLAGYRDYQVSPMFRYAPSNCHLPEGWRIPET